MAFKARHLKQVFNDINKKEDLLTSLKHGDIGHDNSYFLTKEDYQKLLNTDPNALTDKERQFIEFVQKKKPYGKSIEDGVVVLGTGEKYGGTPEVLAHELGHAANHKEHKWLNAARHPLIPIGAGAIGATLMTHDHPLAGAGLIAAGALPTLYDEGRASWRAYHNLKDLGHKPKTDQLTNGFGTYALNAAVPVGLGGLGYFAARYQNDA